MKNEELKMLRQFVDTIFELTHGWDYDKMSAKQEEVICAIGNAAFTARSISKLYQEKEAKNDDDDRL